MSQLSCIAPYVAVTRVTAAFEQAKEEKRHPLVAVTEATSRGGGPSLGCHPGSSCCVGDATQATLSGKACLPDFLFP